MNLEKQSHYVINTFLISLTLTIMNSGNYSLSFHRWMRSWMIAYVVINLLEITIYPMVSVLRKRKSD